jgi:arylsulfatase A-like enzyme
MKIPSPILIVSILLAVADSCPTAAAPPRPERPRPNLLLITLDSTRSDHLGCYGYALPTSPQIDRVARQGVRFSDANSQIPLTGPSHATMMTGLHPHEHGAVRNGVPLPSSARTLAERLRDEGYRTAAFLSGWTLRANLSGMDQGFDLYNDRMEDRYRLVNTQRFASQVTPKAVAWLVRHADAPFFLWVHYFDPHSPYLRRPELFDWLGDRKTIQETVPSRTLRYDSEIRFMDTHTGVVFRTLRKLGLEGDTLVVIAGDHGESLGEHGYVGHGRHLYEEIVRVPLILSWPGRLPRGLTIDTPVALIDLVPTLLSLLHLPALGTSSGVDLSPLLLGSDETVRFADRRIHFETYPGARKRFWKIFSKKVSLIPTLVGFRQGNLKLVYDTKRGLTRIHDLSEAGERENLLEQYSWLRSSGADLIQRIQAAAAIGDLEPPGDDDLERLRSLGYVR